MSNSTNPAMIREVFRGLSCPFAVMAMQMSFYSLTVLYPALLLKSAGIWRPSELGIFPARLRQGGGQLYCVERSTPSLLEYTPPEYEQAAKFDELSALYEVYV